MKSRRNPHIGSKKAFIISLILSPLVSLALIFLTDDPAYHLAGIILTPAMVGFSFYAWKREQKADRKATEDMPEMVSGRKFDSAEWREGYLKFKLSGDALSPVRGDMAKDIKRRFINKSNLGSVAIGLFLLLASPCIVTVDNPVYAVMGVIIGAVFLWLSVPRLLAFPARKWLKTLGNERAAIEESYTRGEVAAFDLNFLNIGKWGIVACDGKSVRSFPWEQISDIQRKIVRVKKYDHEMYDGEEYQYFLVITPVRPMQPFQVELGDFRSQMILEEYQRMTGNNIQQTIDTRKTYSNT